MKIEDNTINAKKRTAAELSNDDGFPWSDFRYYLAFAIINSLNHDKEEAFEAIDICIYIVLSSQDLSSRSKKIMTDGLGSIRKLIKSDMDISFSGYLDIILNNNSPFSDDRHIVQIRNTYKYQSVLGLDRDWDSNVFPLMVPLDKTSLKEFLSTSYLRSTMIELDFLLENVNDFLVESTHITATRRKQIIKKISTELEAAISGAAVTSTPQRDGAKSDHDIPAPLRTKSRTKSNVLDTLVADIEQVRASRRLVRTYDRRKLTGIKLSAEELEQVRAARRLVEAYNRRQRLHRPKNQPG